MGMDMIGIYGLYALYRKILPPNVNPDTNIHKLLSIEIPRKKCPIICILNTNIIFCPISFLKYYAPLRSIDKYNDLFSSSSNFLNDYIRNYVMLSDKSLFMLSSKYQYQTLQWIL